MAKMPSDVCYGPLASSLVEVAVAILETANTVARVWVIEYEQLKLLHSGCLVLF